MSNVVDILNILNPYEDPQEGIDFFVDGNQIIVPERNVKVAAKILRLVNQSKQFDQDLVNMGISGDSISLAFDNVQNSVSLHMALIGDNASIRAEVKSNNHEFFVYIDGKRKSKIFKTLASAKRYVKSLDRQLKEAVQVNDYNEFPEEDE